MKFLEHWIEYITGAVSDPSRNAYHFELNYPEEYKSNETKIIKFERDHNRFLEYRFIGLFPLALNSTRVSYQGSQVLKASASFSFDRYICGESSSLARDLGIAYNNNKPTSAFTTRRPTGYDLNNTLPSVLTENGAIRSSLNFGAYTKVTGKTNLAAVTKSIGNLLS